MIRTILLVLVMSVPASAAELFDNFSDSYSQTNGVYIVGPASPNPPAFQPIRWAMPFEVNPEAGSGPWVLTSVEVPVRWQTYGTDSLEVHLHLDDVGVPGARVGSATIPDVSSAVAEVREATFEERISLAAATTYWVVINAVEDGEHTWQVALPEDGPDVMLYWYFNSEGPWTGPIFPASGLRVNGEYDGTVAADTPRVSEFKARY